MIKVSFSSNVKRFTSNPFDENTTTVRQFLEENEIVYSRAITSIDGCPLQAGDMDKTFADFGNEVAINRKFNSGSWCMIMSHPFIHPPSF